MEVILVIKTPITQWFRYNKDGTQEFNHIEDGHSLNDKPTPLPNTKQSEWQKFNWTKKFVYLENNKIVD
jgi:hypothetical protein